MQFFSLDNILGIGSIIFALAYSYERLRSGGKQNDSDLITSLTNNLKAQKEINDSMSDQQTKMQAQILELTQEVGKLKGINEANDKKVQEYLQIITNRNPELEQTLVKLEALIREVVPFMEDVKNWHQELRDKVDAVDKHVTQINATKKRKEAV